MSKIIELIDKYEIGLELLRTLYMVFVPVIIAYLFGIILGVLTIITDKEGIRPKPWANRILNGIINLGRAIPFIILLCLLVPVTRFLVGTSIGPTGAIVPLTVASIPFVARVVEQSLKEVDQRTIDAVICMGASPIQVVFNVYLVEALPSLIRGLSLTIITLISYTAMSGAVGGQGLGYLAINQGYQRNNPELMYLSVVIIIVLVFAVQISLELVAKKINKKK